MAEPRKPLPKSAPGKVGEQPDFMLPKGQILVDPGTSSTGGGNGAETGSVIQSI